MIGYAALAATEREMEKTMIDQMVDRFLGWRLPYDFAPDGGVRFTPPPKEHPTWWPTGTCLLTAAQAKAMFEHCAGGQFAQASMERLREESRDYHSAMACLRDMKLPHGTCQPRERMACAHCNAVDRLNTLVADYRAPRLILSNA